MLAEVLTLVPQIMTIFEDGVRVFKSELKWGPMVANPTQQDLHPHKKQRLGGGHCCSVSEYLDSVCEALALIPATHTNTWRQTHTKDEHMKTQGEGSHLPAKEMAQKKQTVPPSQFQNSILWNCQKCISVPWGSGVRVSVIRPSRVRAVPALWQPQRASDEQS